MIKNDIQALLLPIVSSLGYELWGCDYIIQGKYTLLRIYIDKENGIGIQDCEQVSKQVAAVLDVEDPIPGNYSLEVSSPGIPRPLFFKEHYQRYIGQSVQLKLYNAIHRSRRLMGIIESVNEDGVVLSTDAGQQEIQFSQIVKANLIGE